MPKTHRKTRTGCRQCRKGRVKCDEEKPCCANCSRNHLECSFEFLTPVTTRINIVHQQPRPPPKAPYLYTPNLSPELPPWSFDSTTHELLHHYTTIVATSLAGPREPSIWHTAMPHMALSHPFLLSGLLAVSALHLSTLYPHRRCELQTLAVVQECEALPSYRNSLRNPNAETIHAIFAFAGYVVPYILASQGGADRYRLPTKQDIHPHWFQAIRGLMVLLMHNFPTLSTGPFGRLLYRDIGPHDPSDNPRDEELAKLEGIFPDSSPLSSPLSPPSSPFFSPPYALSCREDRKLNVCREALKELRHVSALPYSPSKTLCAKTIVYIWPGSVSQEYMDLIYERDPRALIVLAHFCVLLKRIDHIWFLRGLGPGLLGNIWKVLGEEWRPWIQWAMDQPCLEQPEH